MVDLTDDLDEEETSFTQALYEPFKKKISAETRTASVAETQEFETATENFADELKTNEVIPSSPSISLRKRSLEMYESQA